jgi:hypothetical protein
MLNVVAPNNILLWVIFSAAGAPYTNITFGNVNYNDHENNNIPFNFIFSHHLLSPSANSSGWNQTFDVGMIMRVLYHYAKAADHNYVTHNITYSNVIYGNDVYKI